MRVLVTRTESDAADMKVRLEQLGLSVSLAPLLSVAFETIAPDALLHAGGLIATSRNGLRALARSKALPRALGLPLFAVGPATAALGRELGFTTVVEGPGTASGLAPVIEGWKSSLGSAPLVQLAGDKLAFDLQAALAPKGVTFKLIPSYRIEDAAALPLPVQGELAHHQIGAVILMSPRSAQIWARLVKTAVLEGHLSTLTHVCLSKAVADGLQGLPSPKIAVAARPTEPEILSLMRRLAAGAGTG